MATKKEMVKELRSNGVNQSEADLMKLSHSKLEDMVNDLDTGDAEEETVNDGDLMAQMKAEMEAKMALEMAKMREQVRKELESEMASGDAEDVQHIPTAKKKIENDRMIPIMNISPNGLIYISRRTGAEWEWSEYGDIEYMEMQELQTMRTSQKRFLSEPWVLILDEEVVSFMGLDKMYKNMVHPDNIEQVFSMKNADFKEVIEKVPNGIAQLICNRAVTKVADGTLDSVAKIKVLNDKYNLDLRIGS